MSTSACFDTLKSLALTPFEYPVEAPDVAVLLGVAGPVELQELVEALELADDAVTVERRVHPIADVLPSLEFLAAQAQLLPQLLMTELGDEDERTQGPRQQPHDYHVRVGVVVDSGRRVGVGVLVGTHHVTDLGAIPGFVKDGDARPEPGDPDHRLGAVERHEGQHGVHGDTVLGPSSAGWSSRWCSR